MNCESKQNPTDKTTLLATCQNCNGQKPLYNWDMFSRPEGSTDESAWVNKTEYLASQAMVDIYKSKNLAIKPNTFERGDFFFF